MLRHALPIAMLATPAIADADFSRDLATVLAAEALCGLTFNQAAIADFIQLRVDPADLSFAATLQRDVRYAELFAAELTGSVKVAYCAAVEQTARHYGFL